MKEKFNDVLPITREEIARRRAEAATHAHVNRLPELSVQKGEGLGDVYAREFLRKEEGEEGEEDGRGVGTKEEEEIENEIKELFGKVCKSLSILTSYRPVKSVERGEGDEVGITSIALEDITPISSSSSASIIQEKQQQQANKEDLKRLEKKRRIRRGKRRRDREELVEEKISFDRVEKKRKKREEQEVMKDNRVIISSENLQTTKKNKKKSSSLNRRGKDVKL